MNKELLKRYFYWINERERIRIKKERGDPWPWTEDIILRDYKFTNVKREDDKTTRWMRRALTIPAEKRNRPECEFIFNCIVFRWFGYPDFWDKGGMFWIEDHFDWREINELAKKAVLEKGVKIYTSGYMIPNIGIKEPKSVLVTREVLQPIWDDLDKITEKILKNKTLENTFNTLFKYKGMAGSGFMNYEAVTDLRHTPVLRNAPDIGTWANAGLGAVRGLNRLHGREKKVRPPKSKTLAEMQELLKLSSDYLENHINLDNDLRNIEHCLCEVDKYERIRLGEGKMKSHYRPGGLNVKKKGFFK